MPRDLSISNGHLLVNFDRNYVVRDIFFPWIGMENHTGGDMCRTGVWVEGQFTWLSEPSWTKELHYEAETMVTDVTLQNQGLGLSLHFNDAVDLDRNLFVRKVTIRNLSNEEREIRLFFHYDFHIYGVEIGDTVYYDPDSHALVAYKGRRYFILGGQVGGIYGISSWAMGQTEIQGREGTWRDAEDGELSRNPIAQGSVDTTLSLSLRLKGGGEGTLYHWLGAGTSSAEVKELYKIVVERGPELFVSRTSSYWRAWVNKERPNFPEIPASLSDLYKRSLLVIRTHVDHQGAIIASTDFDATTFNRDTYCYMWPRDGAIASLALDNAGYSETTRRFLAFCAKVIPLDGYFMHKYTPGGEVASSWHPWVDQEGRKQLPIQEDETGLVLYSLSRHYDKWRDIEFITPYYRRLIKNAGDFLASYREPNTGLPFPSYDLWEERRGIHAFTMASVWVGLQAAAYFAELFNEPDLFEKYRKAAEEIKAATTKYLFHRELNRFLRSIFVRPDGSIEQDPTVDSSIAGLFKFGMYSASDPLIVSTMEALRSRLWCKTSVGGMARYEGDEYYRVVQDREKVPGNPWPICTLWLAQYYIARARTVEEMTPALELLQWVERYALPSGVISEQVHPYTGEPLSVSPLIWSQAELALTVQQYVGKHRYLAGKSNRTIES